ncbi:hypothetical protein H0H92_011669 [Tricholoma furcatifolium]|nr:hypothetical protein H0H92_011669 [Tricholoma furcatifolium]
MAEQREPQRPPSIRSVASNSSIASGVSLTRKPRTRARSRTVTGGSHLEPVRKSSAAELPCFVANLTDEPLPLSSNIDIQSPPPRPSRSPRRDTSDVSQSHLAEDGDGPSLQDENQDLMNPVVQPSQTQNGLAKFTSQTSGMQILPTLSQPKPPPSAFSRDPEVTGFDPVNVRDSVSTQLSALSSSVYPPSISTTSGPDSPLSPRSMSQQEDSYDVSSYDPDVGETQVFDSDDVSYRLRLLVNNNYFLPPAHSKPSAADFAALEKTVQKKPSTPTFFDRLRGRSKSKPPTPTGLSPGFDPNGPALRTAADSITTSHILRPQPPRASSQFQRGPPPETRTGRVVVVREKMEDISIAAKQVELEVKARGFRRDQGSQKGYQAPTDVIDPTDAVDLPPPSSNYPFAVQASALHGLGVQDSVGAALLADRLPPPQSPGMYEDNWKKTLLHQAVHHSLDSTPNASFSVLQGTSTPRASPSPAPLRGSEPPPLPRLDQRIVSHISDGSHPVIARKKSSQSIASSSRSKSKRPGSNRKPMPLETSGTQQVAPPRSSTPSGPLTPLTPAPRKHAVNLSHSTSHSELEHRVHPEPGEGPSRAALRRTFSSPILSDAYESEARKLTLTPPPLPTPTISTESFYEMRNSSRAASHSFLNLDDHDREMFDDDGVPRRSFAMSAIEGQPSLSEYSQPSPTMSAFRDAPQHGTEYQSSWPSVDHDFPSNDSPSPRYSAMSPPPRMSSSLAHFALSPPPRSTSLNYQVRSSPSPRVSDVGQYLRPGMQLDQDPTLVITAPEPTTPPFPLAHRRGNSAGMQLSLEIPPTNIPVAIHSAPGPPSPTSFFDSIQAQPNAMDDLDSSSDEDDDDDGAEEETTQFDRFQPSTPNTPDPRNLSSSTASASSRPSLMRLGNHSTPYVSQTASEFRRPSTGIKDKKPIGNVPIRAPFFREVAGKSDQGHGLPVSSFEFYKYAQHGNKVSGRPSSSDITSQRRSTLESVPAWRTMNPKAQESLRKLDGMLIQHMEAEKDTIKRIAATARSNSNIPIERGP